MTGTAFAQIIPLAITPILTRIYTPEDFGLLALYLSTVSILSIVVTGNYEKAIIMPRDQLDAVGLVKLSIILTSIGCIVILTGVLIFDTQIASFYNNKAIEDLLLYVPLSVFALAIYNTMNTWFNRVKEYKRLSYNRVTKSSISSGLSIGFGFLNLHALGLILGEFFGQLFATLLFSRSFYHSNRHTFWKIKGKPRELAGTYKNFPLYTLPADMLSMASYQLPVFVFAKIFSQSIVGFYSLCIRVMDKPVVFLTSAIYEVFRQKAMEDYNQFGNCLSIFKKTFLRLVLLAFPTMTFMFIAAPFLFRIVFGAQWEIAGHYARIISVMYLFRFVASPLSFTFYVAGKQKLDFILHVYVFASSACVLAYAYFQQLSVDVTLIIFVVNYSTIYSFYLFKSYQFAHGQHSTTT